MESRFGKADLIVVDPKMVIVSKKTLKSANRMGQPIPVVTLDYIYDSVAQGERFDFDDPKYKYDGSSPQIAPVVTANNDTPAAARSFGGRNPFTDNDRAAIVAYFIDKPEASWSLNTAAKELATTRPTHTHSSYQTYLQNNFEKGWNLKEQVLLARRAALQDEPSELQARILRSQYTASPGPAEQSAPSDGWPCTASASSHHDSSDQQSRHSQDREPPLQETSPAEEDEEDLQVRQPNPGAAIQDVERSPTKVGRPVASASSSHSGSRHGSVEPPPSGQRIPIPASPPVDEESDPDNFSPAILEEIERAERLRFSQPKVSQPQRRTRRPSNSSYDSELDQLDTDSDEDMLTTDLTTLAPKQERDQEDASEDSEWEGTRQADRKIREKDHSIIKEGRTRFKDEEKMELIRQLVDHVLSQGRAPDASTQQAILAKPEDAFWSRFAQGNPTHSLASWRSHYLKNRATYKQIIDHEIAARNEASEESQAGQDDHDHDADSYEDDDEDHDNDDGEGLGEGKKREALGQAMVTLAENERQKSDDQHENQQNSSSDEESSLRQLQSAGRNKDDRPQQLLDANLDLDDVSIPADGIVVMIPSQSVRGQRRARRIKPKSIQQRQWPQAPTPPPMEGKEQEDMMQVEAVIDAIAEESDRAPDDSNDQNDSNDQDIQGQPEQFAAVQDSDSGHSMQEDEAPVLPPAKTSSPTSLPRASTPPTRSTQPRERRGVDAGTPILAQHRDAPFYDFTIDSDEEQRIRKARSRPSMPNLPPSRKETIAGRSPPQLVTTKHVIGHLATPSRDTTRRSRERHLQLTPQHQKEDDRIQRTREWARSVSVTPASASPDLIQDIGPVVAAETSRSRASRIDRRPLLTADRAPSLATQLLQSVAKTSRRVSGERGSTAIPTTSPTPAREHRERSAEFLKRSIRASELDREAARLHFRAEVQRLRGEFGLDMPLTRELLLLFKGRVKDARTWLGAMRDEYGADAEVAFEYLSTSNGDLAQAENFLRLATVVRSSSAQRLLGRGSSRSASYSVSPIKRGAGSDERSSSRVDRQGGRAESSKRDRR